MVVFKLNATILLVSKVLVIHSSISHGCLSLLGTNLAHNLNHSADLGLKTC
ncbi:uncharacterized protein DS421_20g692630 [Arachis hypogaea]|nr:uncharacterized protein DS421_20g692630 [Arachis hypogaea]